MGFEFSAKVPHLHDWLTLYDDMLLPNDNPTNLDMSQSPTQRAGNIGETPSQPGKVQPCEVRRRMQRKVHAQSMEFVKAIFWLNPSGCG